MFQWEEIYTQLLRDLLAPDKPDTRTFEELSDALTAHFEPKPLVIAERFYFYNRNQKPTESVAEYVAELRRFATHCGFGDGLNDALRDRLVCGLRNHGIQQRLLTEAGLTLLKAVEIAQGQEAAAQNLKKLRSASEGIETVQRVTSTQGRGTERSRETRSQLQASPATDVALPTTGPARAGSKTRPAISARSGGT